MRTLPLARAEREIGAAAGFSSSTADTPDKLSVSFPLALWESLLLLLLLLVT